MQLKFVNGELKGLAKDIPPSGLNIGRETDNDLQLLIGGVSRYHARIEVRGTRFFIKDLGSTNGTKVNGIRIEASYPLQEGDELLIGDQQFICEEPAAAAAQDNKTARMPALLPINQNASAAFPLHEEPQSKSEPLQATARFTAPAGSAANDSTPQASQASSPDSASNAAPAFVFRPPQPISPDPVSASTPSAASVPAQAENKPDQPAAAGQGPHVSAPSQPENAGPSKPFSFTNIFAQKSEDGKREESVKKHKTIISNLIFYLLVVAAASICISVFLTIQEKPVKDNGAAGNRQSSIRNPFTLYYEKLIVTPERTIFKFKLLIENKKLSFVLDDLQTGRSYAPQINDELSDDVINKLKEDILKTDFMTSVQENYGSGASDDRNYIRIMAGFDDKFNDLTVQDTVPNSFAKVEMLIKDFLRYDSGYNIDPSIASSRDELLQEANQTFQLAQDQFARYESDPPALAKSIVNYQIAMQKYEVFAEKPKEWNIARANLAQAQSILNEIRNKGRANVNLYYGRRDFDAALEECEKLLMYFEADGPDRETHDKIKSTKLKIERIRKGDK